MEGATRSLLGEHGIGKQDWLVKELGEDAVALMRTLKRALDPDNLFNPGKIFPAVEPRNGAATV